MANLEDQILVKELLQQNLVTKENILKIENMAKETIAAEGITKTLLKFLAIDEAKISKIISDHFNIPLLTEINDLTCVEVPGLSKNDLIMKFRIVPIISDKNEVTIAIVDPPYQKIIDLIKKVTNRHVLPVVLKLSDFNELINKSDKKQEITKPIKIDFELIDVEKRGENWAYESETSGILPPANKVLEKLLETALNSKTSDIHFEIVKKGFLKVRFRLQGVLHRVVTLPQIYSQTIPGVIKQSSSVDSFDKKVLQEGHRVFNIQGQKINTRINTIITSYGEKITIRILKKNLHIMSIDQLGLSVHDFQRFKELLIYTDAIILFVGPSGCGKTTTMYSALNELNHNSLNISTVENPIECLIDGINQTSIDQIRKNSISDAIRALFHHDVDVLTIGEIRGKEEADLLLEAGLTGMTACSTLQASNAIKALYRLQNLEVKYNELALVLRGIVAQRFVRKNCPHCVEEYLPDKKVIERAGLLNIPKDTLFKKGKGCKLCLGSGYLDRIPLFEILLINDTLSSLIHRRSSYSEIKMAAEKIGFTSMRYDGLRKAFSGITTLDEVIRVT